MPSNMGTLASFFLSYEATNNIGSVMLRDAITDLFPGVQICNVTIHAQVACMGGRASRGDVVSFFESGAMCVGELLVALGVDHGNDNSTMYCIIALWRFLSRNQRWANFATENGDKIVKIRTDDSLRGVHTYRMAPDGNSCLVYLPEM